MNKKEKIRTSLDANDLPALVMLACKDRRTVSALVRIAYDKETLAGRRAIKAAAPVRRRLFHLDRVGGLP